MAIDEQKVEEAVGKVFGWPPPRTPASPWRPAGP